MAFHDIEIKEYKIIHWDNFGKEVVRVNCYQSGGLVAVLHFFPDGDHGKVPEVSGRVVHLKYSFSEYDSIITTMRYEKPVYVFLNTPEGDAPFGGIKTGAEPVGEEES